MRVLVAVVLMAAVAAGPVWADQHPDVRLFLTFDQADYVHEIADPGAGVLTIYVCADCVADGEGIGLWGAAFKVERTFGGTYLALTNMLNPGITPIGHPETGIGAAVASGGLCIDGGIVPLASILYSYNGTPGTLKLIPHETDGAVTADCNNDLDTWCVAGNAGVGVAPPAPDADCDCDNPVEATTWGTIKALYR